MSTEGDSESDVSTTVGDSEADVGDSDDDVLSTVSDLDGDVRSTAAYLDAEAGDLEGSVYADADVEHETDEDDDNGVDYEGEDEGEYEYENEDEDDDGDEEGENDVANAKVLVELANAERKSGKVSYMYEQLHLFVCYRKCFWFESWCHGNQVCLYPLIAGNLSEVLLRHLNVVHLLSSFSKFIVFLDSAILKVYIIISLLLCST